MTPARRTPSSGLVWCVLVGGWSLVFAAPHFYWALGGRAGLGAEAAAADAALRQGWFAVYNLAAGCAGLSGAVAGAVIATRVGGPRLRHWLLVAAGIACVGLLLRGALGLALLGVGMLSGTSDEQVPLVLLAIEPWFVLGGVVFAGMVLSHRREPAGAGRLSR